MDGIQEASNQPDSAVSSASVSCVVALLGTLEDLSNGQGLSDENIEMLHKLKEPDNIQELSGKALLLYENSGGEGGVSLKCSSLDSEDDYDNDDVDYDEMGKPNKSKHIKWKMDYEENQHGL